MWLRDTLPDDLPGARVLTYGYDTRLAESNSFQNLEDVALTFRASLRIALGSRAPDRPLVFIAHSLGGLVLKQALIQMASGDAADRRIFQSTYGILFFGVPNQGMDTSSLLAMVGSQPNLSFLTMLSKDSGNLQGLVERFRSVFDFRDSEIISFYETCASRTVRKNSAGRWSMSGDYAILVDRYSAKSGRSWEENHPFLQPIGHSHSDMVKFSEYDDFGAIVGNSLLQFAKAAPAVIRNRIKSMESTTSRGSSDAQRLPLRQPLGEEAKIEVSEKPVEADNISVEVQKATRQQPVQTEGSKERAQEVGSKVKTEKRVKHAQSRSSIRENEDDLKMFANAGFDMEVQTSRSRGLTWAARKGHVSLAQHLLDRGTTVEHKDGKGFNPLHWTALTANLKLFRMLSSQRADFQAITDYGNSMLHLCCLGIHYKGREADDYIGISSDRKAICLELLDMGLPIDVLNTGKATPLFYAAKYGQEDMVQFLISYGADLAREDQECRTPLMLAAENEHMSIVETLIGRQQKHTPGDADWCLVRAAAKNMKSAVRILLDSGVMINTVNDRGETALISASQRGRDDIVRLLLEKAADLEAKNRDGHTALICAVGHCPASDCSSYLDTVRLLIDKGANVQAKSKSGKSALHQAAKRNNRTVIQILLDSGADPLARDKHGESPLRLALQEGYTGVVKLLSQE